MIDEPWADPGTPPTELEELRIAAANERLAEQRHAVPALNQRCTETGIDAVKSRDDLVPLLFSHATYKTYPESFIHNQRWDRLSLWLETVSTPAVSDVDLNGVADIDDWITRLRGAGHHIVVSSGTSGKNSFLLMTEEDVQSSHRTAVAMFDFPYSVQSRNDRPCVLLAPGPAPMRYWYRFQTYASTFGREGAVHTLGDEPFRISDLMREAVLRRSMAEGTVTPEDLAAARSGDRSRERDSEAAMVQLSQVMLDYRDEPQVVLGYWATWWRVLLTAQKQGLPGGLFHPETTAFIGGGLKGLKLPDDYEEQMSAFLGDIHRPSVYGMTELSTDCPRCEHGNYHVAPWMTLLVVDEAGEHLESEDDDGWVAGRAAFYDPLWTGRWGGIVTGDRVRANYHAACPCGRAGTVISSPIARYAEGSAGGDDKLTCGGTIEQYIRGIFRDAGEQP